MNVIHPELWTADSNEVFEVSLVKGDGATVGHAFNPKFTYPIFGEAEAIYGFKELEIELKLGSASLIPFLKVTYSAKLEDKAKLATVIREDKRLRQQEQGEDQEEVKDEDEKDKEKDKDNNDPEATLRKFLPHDAFSDEKAWLDEVGKAETEFTPPGVLMSSYSHDNKSYEVWKAPISDPLQQVLHYRMQIFVLLLVEGGSYIDATDDRWWIYTLYEKSSEGKYTFAGYSTVYSYLWYKNAETYTLFGESDNNSSNGFVNFYQRKRISQFMILPPFQGQKHGPRLYNILMDEFCNDPMVKEVTVEDPNVAFDDMRDRCDMQRLDKLGVWKDDGFTDAPVSKAWIAQMQEKTKIIPRQFLRCVEMALLRRVNKRNREAYRQYRLQVKQRLFKHNREALKDLDKWQRIEKLNETYKSIELDYYRLIEGIPTEEHEESTIEQPIRNKGRGKRAQLEDEADASKRAKLE
ncbi:acyl-CoA N-acyltransferase [Lipomyces arxii]|uniref:acyl-CoA N-acyltransferase n=1 Tax=Lipomyces arxii TaxID=56418 RepID=UPI0034CD1947